VKISNQSLVALLIAAVALIGVAVWLVLRPPPAPTAAEVAPEETILDVPPTVYRRSQSTFDPSGPVVVHAEEGRLIALECDRMRMEREITGGVATFETVPTKTGCSLHFVTNELDDPFIPFSPILPGDDVMCRVDAKAVVCDGSLASLHAGTIRAWSPGEGELKIDGELVGPVPIDNHRLPVGKHKLEFTGKRARSSWTLTVRPDESIDIMFHSPARDGSDLAGPPEEPAAPPAEDAPAQPTPEPVKADLAPQNP
jgi:hypothetical protein